MATVSGPALAPASRLTTVSSLHSGLLQPDAFSTLAELEAIQIAFAGPLDRAAHRYQAEEVRRQAASRVVPDAAAAPPRQEIQTAPERQERPPNPVKRDAPAATSTSTSSSSSSGIALGPSLPAQPRASSSVHRTPAPAPSAKPPSTPGPVVAARLNPKHAHLLPSPRHRPRSLLLRRPPPLCSNPSRPIPSLALRDPHPRLAMSLDKRSEHPQK